MSSQSRITRNIYKPMHCINVDKCSCTFNSSFYVCYFSSLCLFHEDFFYFVTIFTCYTYLQTYTKHKQYLSRVNNGTFAGNYNISINSFTSLASNCSFSLTFNGYVCYYQRKKMPVSHSIVSDSEV